MLISNRFRSRSLAALATIAALAASAGHGPLRADPPSAARVAPDLRITSPADGATVDNWVSLKVAGAGGLHSVEYVMNDYVSLGDGPVAIGDFTCPWQPRAGEFKGNASIKAIGRDADGRVVATSPPIQVWVDNPRTRSLEGRLRSPAPGSVVSGKITLRLACWNDDAVRATPVLVYVDGVLAPYSPKVPFRQSPMDALGESPQEITYPLDTCRFPNGEHVVTVLAGKGEFAEPGVLLSLPLTFRNGRAFMEVRPTWRTLVLRPGASERLTVSAAYTDGSTEPLDGASFTPEDGGKGTFTLEGDTVRAVKPGAGWIDVAAHDSEARVYVYVEEPAAPHFAKDGRILQSYRYGSSILARSMFFLGPDRSDHPNISDETFVRLLKDADLNLLEANPMYPAFESKDPNATAAWWKTTIDSRLDPQIRFARAHGFHYYCSGDYFARSPDALSRAIGLGLPWGDEALRYAMQKWADSDVLTFIDLVDEASMIFGRDPYHLRDAFRNKVDPPLPADALVRLRAILRSVKGPVPAALHPIHLALGPTAEHYHAFGDYSHYSFDIYSAFRFYNRVPLGSWLKYLKMLVEDRQAYVPRGIPMTSIAPTEAAYTEATSEPGPQPGVDFMTNANGEGTEYGATAFMMDLLGQGVAGFRSYFYRAERPREAKPGEWMQAGMNFFDFATKNWQFTAAVFNFMAAYEPYILQPRLNAPYLGAQISTQARGGRDSRLLFVCNFSEGTVTRTVDLSPYRFPDGQMIRTVVRGAELGSTALGNPESYELTLRPGESVALLSVARGSPAPAAVAITAPATKTAFDGSIAIKAEASSPAGIARVEFFVDGTRIGADTTPPYTATWDGRTPWRGTFRGIRAVAFANNGQKATSRIALRPVDAGFATLPPPAPDVKPVISDIRTTPIAPGKVEVTWTTDRPVPTELFWRYRVPSSDDGRKLQAETPPTTRHRLVISDLKPSAKLIISPMATDIRTTYAPAKLLDLPSPARPSSR